MRILLVKPHSWFSAKGFGYPLSLAALAAVLLKEGYEVKVLDLMLSKPETAKADLRSLLAEFQPDLVGITCNSHERFYSFDIARWVKDWRDIPVAMGGPHVTFTAEETLQDIGEVDTIVLHEGEETILELCSSIETGSNMRDVKGIVFKENGDIVRTASRPFIKDLDSLPLPARHLFPIEKYDLHLPIPGRPKAMHMLTSRGCPFPCRFCSATAMAGRKIRYQSAKRVVDELEEICASYPSFQWIFMYDDHLTLNKKRVMEICQEIFARKVKINWGCYGRVDSIDKKLVEAMASAGCKMISFGVESGSDRVLALMDKRITRKQIETAIKTVKAAGIIARSSFISGYPGETLFDFISTISLIWKTRLTKDELVWNVDPLIYPGTHLFEQLTKSGYLPENFSWSHKMDIPDYKDVPVCVSQFSRLKFLIYRAYRKFIAGEEEISESGSI